MSVYRKKTVTTGPDLNSEEWEPAADMIFQYQWHTPGEGYKLLCFILGVNVRLT